MYTCSNYCITCLSLFQAANGAVDEKAGNPFPLSSFLPWVLVFALAAVSESSRGGDADLALVLARYSVSWIDDVSEQLHAESEFLLVLWLPALPSDCPFEHCLD